MAVSALAYCPANPTAKAAVATPAAERLLNVAGERERETTFEELKRLRGEQPSTMEVYVILNVHK